MAGKGDKSRPLSIPRSELDYRMDKIFRESEYKKQYIHILQSGMFWEVYPQLTGKWEQDKDEFIKMNL